MIERHVLTLAAGSRGEDPARSKGERGSRRRSVRAPQHVWIERADGGLECRWCRMRNGAEWVGASMGCGNAHAKNIATKKPRKVTP